MVIDIYSRKAIRIFLTIVVALSTTIGTTSGFASESSPSKKPPYSDWQMVASSDLIVQGKFLTVGKPTSGVSICVFRPGSFLKGSYEGSKLLIRYPVEAGQESKLDTLKALRGKASVVFLNRVRATTPVYWTFRHDESGIQTATDAGIKDIVAEIENEKLINANFAELKVADTDQYDRKVSKLFLELQSPSTSEKALASLEKMNEDTVPSIIRAMTLSPILCKRRIIREAADSATQTVESLLLDICAAKTGLNFPNQEAWRTWLYYSSPEPQPGN